MFSDYLSISCDYVSELVINLKKGESEDMYFVSSQHLKKGGNLF